MLPTFTGRRAVGLVWLFSLPMQARGRGLWSWACWAAATLGHVLPMTRRFRGGKGVATAGGGSLVLFPLVAAGTVILFGLVARATGKASLGSITIAVVLPVAVAATGRGLDEVLVAAGTCVLVLVRHVANIRRLVAGEEGSWNC